MTARRRRACWCIVIGWTETTQVLVKEGRVDLGERHTYREERIGKAVVWLLQGMEGDVAKAREYAAAPDMKERGAVVFKYPVTEQDPMARGRRDALATWNKANGGAA